MPVFPPLTLSERVDAAKEHLGFKRAERAWIKRRQAEVPVELAAPAYAPVMRYPVLPAARVAGVRDIGRPVHVVVVPDRGAAFGEFHAGTRNFYYEAAQSLREMVGAEHVSVFDVDPGEDPVAWLVRLVDYLHDVGATHVITHIEFDPGTDAKAWTWDVVWGALTERWDGVLLGVMFDSAYDWVAAKSRLLAKMSPRFMVVDICMPMDGSMVRGRPEVGPVNMPVSRESLALVDARLSGIAPQWDVSFIGVMYPYRMELVERLRALGISVVVNPHRGDQAEDNVTSRIAQPSWLDYMAGLASSRMTLNFSQSNAGRYEQLKTRVLEATLAGTLLLTDDIDRTRLFWNEGTQYAYFPTIAELPALVEGLMADPQLVAGMAASGQARAREIAPTHFWNAIDAGLCRRGLPRVLSAKA